MSKRMRPVQNRIFSHENFELSVSEVKMTSTLRQTPIVSNQQRCFECSSKKEYVQLSFTNLIEYQMNDADFENRPNRKSTSSFISYIHHDAAAISSCDCCCVKNITTKEKMSSQNLFTLNVNFTSTPKINKFRQSTAKPALPPVKSYRECLEICDEEESWLKRSAKRSNTVEDTFCVDSSKKSSLAFLSLNDYLRKILQKKNDRKSATKSSSVENLAKRISGLGAGEKDVIDLVVTRKHSLREHRSKRRSLRRIGAGRTSTQCSRHQCNKNKLVTKSTPIGAHRFCDLKFNQTNNYNTSSIFSNGFNQFGQLKVWYV